jgi:hypothetical protein
VQYVEHRPENNGVNTGHLVKCNRCVLKECTVMFCGCWASRAGAVTEQPAAPAQIHSQFAFFVVQLRTVPLAPTATSQCLCRASTTGATSTLITSLRALTTN